MNQNNILTADSLKKEAKRIFKNKNRVRKYIEVENKSTSVSRILFMPTNGSGLGHVTRTLAVARRIKQMYPNVEIIFFTTNFAINIIRQEGFLAYYFPSINLYSPDINPKDIDNAMEEQLIAIVKRHNIDTIVFDGVFPYAYLINVIDKLNILNPIWIQRGMHKSGKSKIVIDREHFFNLIIVPGEANRNYNITQKDDKFRYCPPIIYSKKEELLSRDTIIKMWNLDPNKKTVYIQLGEGLYNDANSLIFKVVKSLKNIKDLQIVLGESIIAHKKYNIDPDIFIIRDYPNSIYFNAFDFAVVTGSYNTFHETIFFGIPTILFPTKETGTDNQHARARIALELKTSFVFHSFDTKKFEEAVSNIMNPTINQSMRNNTKYVFENGAELAARYIMQSV